MGIRVVLSVVITVENAESLSNALEIAQSAVERIRPMSYANESHDLHISGVFVTRGSVSTYGVR